MKIERVDYLAGDRAGEVALVDLDQPAIDAMLHAAQHQLPVSWLPGVSRTVEILWINVKRSFTEVPLTNGQIDYLPTGNRVIVRFKLRA